MSETQTITQLQTRKNDAGATRLKGGVLTADGGDVMLKLSSFALTANNITYAAFGDAVNYWRFFPTGDDEWGHIPVWGFADVVRSSVEGIAVGDRFYGYFPIASHIGMTPVRVSDRGFYDGAEHRLELVSAYNQYTRCSTDPAWSAAQEHFQSLFRPLFLTSFMLADYLRDNRFFGAERIVVSSASAKTAYGTAFCLTDDAGIETVALTSEGNRDFVADLGCYGSIVAYADLESIAVDRTTLYVDFSGDSGLRARIHAHFGRTLVHDCYAGSAQSTEFLGKVDLPGPEPKFYFAPHQIRKRNADWGAAEVTRRAGEAQRLFMNHLNMPGSRRLEIERDEGMEAASAVIADLASGRTDPRKGHIIEIT